MASYSDLDRPARFLRDVGPRRAELLGKLGLLTARDVLYHVPRRYEDASTVQPIGSLRPGADATVVGRIVSMGVLPTRAGLRIFQAIVRDRSGLIECAWPGRPFLDRIFRKGDLVLLSGPVRFYHGNQLQPREYVILSRKGDGPEEGGRGKVFPIYPSTEGLSQQQVRKLIDANIDELLESVADEDAVDPGLLASLELPSLAAALDAMHRPESLAHAERGRRRLAFDELLFLQVLHGLAHRQATIGHPGLRLRRRDTLVRRLYESLPFALTSAQRRVLAEIGSDMESSRSMNRLLQGDVGAGKTVVALFAMLRAVENGYQAALMVPTEILAEQHLRTLRRFLDPLGVPVEILTGRMPAAERRAALARIASGEAAIIVGTHALIHDGVTFRALGLAVVDEQHRFGVRQRMALGDIETSTDEGPPGRPDMLFMSATPIPRSLALTWYGDLDISFLDERPPGRRAVRTALRGEDARGAVLEFVRGQVAVGRQAYLIYPLVEESETLQLKSATDEYERLRDVVFPELRLGLVHGQMPREEKDEVMRNFMEGALDVLVSTTVVEVGIDVANATVMVIEHADRFGLSQLHQLRGRVGRGAEESYCILLAPQPTAIERLRVFTRTEDGFAIAEADLRLRGQGDLFGDRQSGLPEFRFADLVRDGDLLETARAEARALLERDPTLAASPRVREVLERRFEDQARIRLAG